MNIISPVATVRLEKYGNTRHFPNISSSRVFSPLTQRNTSELLLYHTLHLIFIPFLISVLLQNI
jgi:hypothetical protein